MIKLIVSLLSSSQQAEPRALQEGTGVLYHPNTYDNCSAAKPWSIPINSTTTSNKTVVTSWPNSNSVFSMNSSVAAASTTSGPSHATANHRSATSAATTVRETTTHGTRVPGKNGIPGCAYVVAADMGPAAACSADYCNCDGTAAPLLSSQVSGIGSWSTNCDYSVQPTTDSCPGATLLVMGTAYVLPVCTATVGGGETCGYNTITSAITVLQ